MANEWINENNMPPCLMAKHASSLRGRRYNGQGSHQVVVGLTKSPALTSSGLEACMGSLSRGEGRGGGVGGVGRPPFFGANFVHFLYKVL